MPDATGHPRQCTATSQRTGERCRRFAIQGGHVCPHHGGSAPAVRAAANARLADLIPDAIAALHRAANSGDIKAAVKAAQVVLDRTGHGPTSKVELETRAAHELQLQADGIMAVVVGSLRELGVDVDDNTVRDVVRANLAAVAQGLERGERPAALPPARQQVDLVHAPDDQDIMHADTDNDVVHADVVKEGDSNGA